jgi:hypothetical protein
MVCTVLGLYTPSWCRHSSVYWTQLSRFHLKTETESSFRNAVFWKTNRTVILDEARTMHNVQKHNICTQLLYLDVRKEHFTSFVACPETQTQTSMPQVEFEPTITVFGRAKRAHTLARHITRITLLWAMAVIWTICFMVYKESAFCWPVSIERWADSAHWIREHVEASGGRLIFRESAQND